VFLTTAIAVIFTGLLLHFSTGHGEVLPHLFIVHGETVVECPGYKVCTSASYLSDLGFKY